MTVPGIGMALLLLLGLAQEADPSEFIQRLGSDRESERLAAEDALEKLGREALPLLRVATDSQNHAIRSRAKALLERIESTSLLQPTMVTLDFQDRPLSEAVATIRRRSGLPLELFPEDSPIWESRRVTLRERDPVPFLQAIDRLCTAGQLHISLWQSQEERDRPPILRLVDYRGDSGPVSHSGPFRVSLLSVHDHHDLILEEEFRLRSDPRSEVAPHVPPVDQFYVRLQVMAEPRMTIRLDRSPRWIEAVDDRDQSLAPPTAGSRSGVSFGQLAPSLISFSALLKRPDRPGRAIRQLRGVVPVTVLARRPSPLIVPLRGPAGQKAEGQGFSLEVREIRAEPGRPWAAKLFLRTEDPREETGIPSTWPQQGQFELVDEGGQPLQVLFSAAYVDKDLTSVTLRLVDGKGARIPAELRYHSLTRSTAEVPFEFSDIRIP